MKTTIYLHDNVRNAIRQALFPSEGTAVLAVNKVKNISDFERDCTKSDIMCSMVVCHITYPGKRKAVDRNKLGTQIEDWLGFIQIIIGYKIERYLAVLTPNQAKGKNGVTGYSIKIVASVTRGDNCQLTTETLCSVIDRALISNGIMLEDGIVIDNLSQMDFDLSCLDKTSSPAFHQRRF